MPPAYKRKRTYTKSRYSPMMKRTRSSMRYPSAPRGLPGLYARRRLYLRGTPEKKVIDTNFAFTPINTTGFRLALSLCAQGTDFTERIGRKIILKSVGVKGFMAVDPTAAAAIPQMGRMIIVLDKNPNSSIASFAVTDLLDSANATSQLNLNNRARFKVISDDLFTFGFYSTGAPVISMGEAIYPIKMYKKLNIPVVFSGIGGTIADVSENALHVVFVGTTAAGGNDLNFQGNFRIRFEDA